jgi:hypothetical protein
MVFYVLYIYIKETSKETNKMNLEKLLAENMLRFGTKNLVVSNIKPYLAEQQAQALEFNLNEMPAALERINYVPTPSKYIAIPDGNPWLATNRAESLKKFLIANIQKQVGIPFDANAVKIAETAVSPNKGDQYQYVEGTIYGYMEKPPIPEDKYAYDLLYNFYDINNVPHIIVTKIGKGAPVKVLNTNYNSFVPKLEKDGSNAINNGGFVVFDQESQAEGNIAILVPIPKIYNERNGSRLYFKDADTLNQMRQFIQTYTQGNDEYGRDPNSNYLSSNWTNTQGGGGNYLVGRESGSPATIVTGNNKGKTTISRSYYKPTGKGEAPIAGTGAKGAWEKIGDFQLTKEEGSFLDNMITIQPGSYQKIFDTIKADIQAQLAKKLEIKSLTAVIKGYASADRATNRLPAGVNAPDHTYGGAVPAKYWIRK